MNLLMRVAAIAMMLPITPAVVLVKRPDAVEALLPGADAYTARDVHLSDVDAHRLHVAVDWSPEDGVLTFYKGKAGSVLVGALEFVRVDTPHGPIDRKSTRLNSSHGYISYAVFCLKKKKQTPQWASIK